VKEPSNVVLVRHGETEWSAAKRHTSRTDVPLTEEGRRQAERLRACLSDRRFAAVFTSPLQRAVETCRLAGYGEMAQVRDDLREWDYGDYEGRTTAEIRQSRPEWSLWLDGVPNGESIDHVALRADRIIAEVKATDGDVLLFGHGHILRVLTARWLELTPDRGRSFVLDPATVGALGYERENPAILRWNLPCSA
jgi:broad specificity phosphatase PhoE